MTLFSDIPASTRTTEDWLIQVNPKLDGMPRQIALMFASLTHQLSDLPPCAEKSAGMRKLLEARECFDRVVTPDQS